MKRFSKKVAALLLVAVMAVSLFPASVFADAADLAGNGKAGLGEITTEGFVEDLTEDADEPVVDETVEETTEEATPEETEAAEEPAADGPAVAEIPVVVEKSVSDSNAASNNKITSQPQDAIVAPGDKAEFAVETEGKVSKYKWQYSTNGVFWRTFSYKSQPSITVTGRNGWTNSNDENMYRCVVTFKDGSKVTSDAATLYVASARSFSAVKSDNADVSVKAPAGTFPSGTTMDVTDVAAEDYIDAINDALEEGTAAEVTAVDISFNLDGVELEPANGNKVTVTVKSDAIKEGIRLFHISDDGVAEEIAEEDIVSIKDGEAVFASDAFSVYAIVDEGNTGEYARMNLHFMNGETEVAMMIVKNGDTREELDTIIYDPGVGTIPDGTIFKGWTTTASYTVADAENGMNIEEVRDWAAARPITENEDVYLYAMLYKNFIINYLDENGVGVGSENIFMLSNATSSPYTVNMAYTPKDDTHAFLGWNVAEGSSNIQGYTAGTLYENGTEITITGNVTFSVNAPEGHWLVFNENGRGGTYNAPVFIESNQVTSAPSGVMTRFGYTFDGWYDSKEHADAHGADPSVTTGQFQFGSTISDRTTIYASWIPNATANYTIIIWKQNVAGNGYDFEESITGNGNVGSNIPLGNSVNMNYTGFHLKEQPASVAIVPEGNAVVNVYYDRTEYTLSFQVYDYTYTETTSTSNNVTQYGLVNGEYVQLTRHGRNNNYYWTYGDTYYSEGTRYTGTRYTRSNYRSWQTIKAITALYEQNIADNFPIVGTNGVNYAGYVYEPQNSSVFTTGDVPTLETMPAENTTFHIKEYDGGYTYHLYYYLEALKGQTGDVTYNGTNYIEHQHVQINASGLSSTESEDFYDISGFTQYASSPAYSNGRAEFDNNRTIRLYYSRDKYIINYLDGTYVDGNNNPIDEIKKSEGWGASEEIYYQESTQSYNKDGDNYYAPTKVGYVFEGWYMDDSCTQPYTFTVMPDHNITVYAKWRQIQYRVFLHPNADNIPDLDWGSATQAMTFRISLGGTVSVPTGRSAEWEFVGWYTDPSCSASSLFTSDMVLNESTVTAAYDKTKDFTDVMDIWGNGATWNSDITGNNGSDRVWITKKFDLYGKWRSKLIGAKGINVVYTADDGKGHVGTNAPTDNNQYLDQAEATADAASTAPEGYQFVKWVVQKWNAETNKYEDTNVSVYPGDSFEVLKTDARYVITGYVNPKLDPEDPDYMSETQDETHTEIVATYTVQLRAEYVEVGTGAPTHINWYMNTAADELIYSDEDIQINEAVAIHNLAADNSITLKRGYVFIGWAREPEYEEFVDGKPVESTLKTYYENLTEADLFLKYNADNNKYYAQNDKNEWVEVGKIAADEKMPYHALYAVWEKVFYVVHGNDKSVEVVKLDEAADRWTYTTGYTNGAYTTFYYGGYGLMADTTADNPSGFSLAKGGIEASYTGSYTWSRTTAQKNASAFDKTVGDIYYIKEVPSTYLASPKVATVIGDYGKGDITSISVLSVVDTTIYRAGGINGVKGTFASSFTMTQNNGGSTTTTASELFGLSGYLTVNSWGTDNGTFTLVPFWTTYDDITVNSNSSRVLTINGNSVTVE